MENSKVSRLPNPGPQTTVLIFVLVVDIGGCSASTPWSGYIPFSTQRSYPASGIHPEAQVLRLAAMVAGHDAIDLLFNWYGKALDATSLNNIGYVPPTTGEDGFGNSNFDFQVGYSHELYGGGPDLRLSVTGYKFDMDSDVYGYHAGAELKSRDGMFVAKYNVGYDSANQAYQSVAAFINMGFQLENLVAGKSPFVMPKPVFQSPREMTTITQAKPKPELETHNSSSNISSCQGKDIELFM